MSLTPKDLVWYNEGGDGGIKSGGYSVDSLFKTLGVSPMTTDNGSGSLMTGGGNGNNGGKVSDMFRHTAIPAGLTLMSGGGGAGFGSNNSKGGNHEMTSDIQHVGGGLISESLFDKLTKLASPDNLLTQETKSSKTTTKPSKKHRVTKKKTKSGNAKANGSSKSKRRNTKKRTK
jgi:hypothetical protein